MPKILPYRSVWPEPAHEIPEGVMRNQMNHVDFWVTVKADLSEIICKPGLGVVWSEVMKNV